MRNRPVPKPVRGLRLKRLTQALATAGLCLPVWLQAASLPTGLQVVQGQASVVTQGSQMTVRNTAGAILNWQSFSIGAGSGVYFEQANAASKVLNRVTGADPSLILGSLASNGQVWLLNPNGVLFGQGARVDVAGLVASTLRLNDNDFLSGLSNGSYRFSTEGSGAAIVNQGSLKTSLGGQVVLLGQEVRNEGSIEASHINLAAARSVTLVDTGAPNLAVQVDVPAGEVLNLGRLVASGGVIDVYGAIVNQQGLVQADTVDTDAQGRVVLRAAQTLTLADGSVTQARGSAGAGGQVDLLGAQVAVLGQALVDVSGASGGDIRLGGGERGQDSRVPNAQAVYFGPEATLRADATADVGHGGRIVLWSDQATRAYGHFSARGGQLGGDGGFVETSGGWLDARPASLDLAATAGVAGLWLLDPFSITINSVGPDSGIVTTAGPVFTSNGNSSVISTATLAQALNAGNSVTVATGSAGSQVGDILVDNATLSVAPPSGVTLTLSAHRDIVVRNSTLQSTAQPLNIELVAAGSGIGVIELYNSTLNTAGGNLTLRGAAAQQLPLPDGSFTQTAYNAAVAYTGANTPSQSLSGGEVAINVEASQLNLGAGTFRATGLTTLNNGDGVRIGSFTGAATTVNAAHIDLVGVSSVASPVNVDTGVTLVGTSTALNATQGLSVFGAGRSGISIENGIRISLAAAPASGAVLSLQGMGTDSVGVVLFAHDPDSSVPGPGTRITVSNAALQITGNATDGPGIALVNDTGAPGPLLDLAGATSASLLVQRSSDVNGLALSHVIRDVDIVVPSAGTFSITGDLGISVVNTRFTGNGGTIELAGQRVEFTDSTVLSTGGALNVGFATTGANPSGVNVTNSAIVTNGGDVRFGAVQLVCSTGLGCTTVASPWVETVTDAFNNNAGSCYGALCLDGATIEAGSGRIYGGGATRPSADSTNGVTIGSSVLRGREVVFNSRSDTGGGIDIFTFTTLAATDVLALDAQVFAGGSFTGWDGIYIGPGTVLQVVDVAAQSGSRLSLNANKLDNNGAAIRLLGGAVGTLDQTVVTVDGAALQISGTLTGGATGGVGLNATGQSAAPGGLLINALGATSVSISGTNQSTLGGALTMSYMNVLGPQTGGSNQLSITGVGGRNTGAPSTQLTNTTIASASPITVLTDGLLLSGGSILGDASVSLLTNTSSSTGRAAAPVHLLNTTVSAAGVGGVLRIEGSQGDAVRGSSGFNSGQGVTIAGSTLAATGAGGSMLVQGRGADAGGSGIVMATSTLQADTLTLDGRGSVLGDGVFADDVSNGAPMVLQARNLSITGRAADSNQSATKVGVRLGASVQLQLSGQGNVLIDGDWVMLGRAGTVQPLQVSGDAATFTVNSIASQYVRNATFDFSSGGGTAVNFIADADNSGAGRLRMDLTTVRSGGGDITMAGVAVGSRDASGAALQINSLVNEGFGGGVRFQAVTLDAGAGTVRVSGTGVTLPWWTGSAYEATWGINLGAATTSITGGRIELNGDGGTQGRGIDVGQGNNPGAVLNLTADSIVVTARGTGTDPALGTLNEALGVANASSTWTVNNGGRLDIVTLGNPTVLSQLSASGGMVEVRGAGPLTLSNSLLQSSGDMSLSATGAPVNGSLFSLSQTTLTAAGALSLDAQASGTPGTALMLLEGTSISGASVSLIGIASQGVGIHAQGAAGSITATSGALSLTGRDPSDTSPGIALEGAWLLQTPTTLSLDFDTALQLGSFGSGTQTPLFSAGQAVNLSMAAASSTVALGSFADLDATLLSAALAGLSATTTTTLSLASPAALLVDGALSVPGRLQVQADALTLSPRASLAAGASGDAVILNVAGAFTNNAGANVLSTPNGRWVLQLDSPANSTLGGLVGAFTAYDLAGTPWSTDANGNLITPAGGNAVGFAVATTALAGGPLSGGLDKIYDASTSILLDPQTWSISGLLSGDTLTLSGVNTATMADKNVGSGKAVTLDGGSVFTVLDANGRPVFGYGTPVFTANVTAATLAVTGVVVAGKVYDATTAASFTSLGTVAALGADVVSLGGASGVFSDKNVGTGKTVTLSGFTLTGADAGNYTLVAPATATADITPRPLFITGLAANNKVYDTTTAATLSGSAGITALGTDVLGLAGTAAASFADKNAGNVKVVTVTGFSLTGTDAANYSLQPVTGLVADITRAPLALTGLSALNKVYDATLSAPLAGTAAVSPLGSDVVGLSGTATGSFASKNVGTAKAVTVGGVALVGVDAGNYSLVLPTGLVADVTPATLTIASAVAANKVYDGNTTAAVTATLGGVQGADVVAANTSASFADRNVGSNKPVSWTALLAGADAGNYTLTGGSGSTTANITPATLTYTATPANGQAGAALPVLTGNVSGFVGGDTQASATTGTLQWLSSATSISPPGSYAINGSGLAALNYQFAQAAGNSGALTLTAASQSDPATNANTTALMLGLMAVQPMLAMSSPVEGRVLDAVPSLSGQGDGTSFRSVNFSLMTREEVQTLLAARASFKRKVLANSLFKLEQDPSLADVQPCKTEAELSTGNCLITEQLKKEIEEIQARAVAKPRRPVARKVRQAVLPNIERKLALLIGVNTYADKRVPQLEGAVPDVRAMRTLLETRLGYEATVVENPTREAIVRAFNKLALEADGNDSVIVYYAGHGIVEPINGVDTGFWLPSDSDADNPSKWISNADIARMVAAVGSRQLMLVSDSCYSGTLAGSERVQLAQKTDAGDLLKRKAAVVLSSGGNEPVSDEGRDGHSVFAWHLMRALEGLDQWQVGGDVFERVRAAVSKEFPQTPQYGASRTAGHQGNTDYLLERREIDLMSP